MPSKTRRVLEWVRKSHADPHGFLSVPTDYRVLELLLDVVEAAKEMDAILAGGRKARQRLCEALVAWVEYDEEEGRSPDRDRREQE